MGKLLLKMNKMKKMKLTIGLFVIMFAVACGQADKTFTVPVRMNAGFYVGADPNLYLTLPSGGVADWNTILNKPSVFAPDLAVTNPLYKPIEWVPTFAQVTSKPTTLSGYGITDAALSTHAHTFTSITGKPTTLVGYGITDAKPLSYVPTYAEITGKPSLFSGSYVDLTNKPTLFSGSYTDLTNKPESIELADAILSMSGIKLPVLTTAQIDALTPTAGLLVYDSTLNVLKIFVGTWKVIITAN